MPSFNSKRNAENFVQNVYVQRAAEQEAKRKADEELKRLERAEARERRREFREWVTLGIALLALGLSVLSLLLQFGIF